mmetsp:Transcript_14041/g.39759  ORF Transcript_14041/g.39759 Transcript_14041/m.39759 type:complete len:255 (-) Transcript_14041:2842-3606(-)
MEFIWKASSRFCACLATSAAFSPSASPCTALWMPCWMMNSLGCGWASYRERRIFSSGRLVMGSSSRSIATATPGNVPPDSATLRRREVARMRWKISSSPLSSPTPAPAASCCFHSSKTDVNVCRESLWSSLGSMRTRSSASHVAMASMAGACHLVSDVSRRKMASALACHSWAREAELAWARRQSMEIARVRNLGLLSGRCSASLHRLRTAPSTAARSWHCLLMRHRLYSACTTSSWCSSPEAARRMAVAYWLA